MYTSFGLLLREFVTASQRRWLHYKTTAPHIHSLPRVTVKQRCCKNTNFRDCRRFTSSRKSREYWSGHVSEEQLRDSGNWRIPKMSMVSICHVDI
jgi:hypothetical protein